MKVPSSPVYKSKFETSFAALLKSLKIPFVYEALKLKYKVPVKNRTYTPDFQIGNTYIETKGYFDAEDRAKLLLVKEQHPELDIRLVFMNANTKIHKKSTTTYGDWATKHGFKWSHKTLPEEWIKELKDGTR